MNSKKDLQDWTHNIIGHYVMYHIQEVCALNVHLTLCEGEKHGYEELGNDYTYKCKICGSFTFDTDAEDEMAEEYYEKFDNLLNKFEAEVKKGVSK